MVIGVPEDTSRVAHRVYVPPQAIQGDRISVTDRVDVHHLLRVLRVRIGDRLECFDGTGQRYFGVVVTATVRTLTVSVGAQEHEPPPICRVRLVQALIRPQRFSWLLEKATGLGVSDVMPFYAGRTRSRPTSRSRVPGALARWQRIVQEAATQCGRATIPTLHEPQSFARSLAALADQPGILCTIDPTAASLEEHLSAFGPVPALTVFIGPEGDFTPEEIGAARERGVRVANLGTRTLRSETAALVALVLIQRARASSQRWAGETLT